MNRSWKTTLSGIATLLSVGVHVINSLASGTPVDVATVVTGITTGIGLLFARDNDKSSESVGAK